MKVTFICKRSGNTVSFTNENDIAQLRTHEGYVEVEECQPIATLPEVEPQKQRGRPRKVISYGKDYNC